MTQFSYRTWSIVSLFVGFNILFSFFFSLLVSSQRGGDVGFFSPEALQFFVSFFFLISVGGVVFGFLFGLISHFSKLAWYHAVWILLLENILFTFLLDPAHFFQYIGRIFLIGQLFLISAVLVFVVTRGLLAFITKYRSSPRVVIGVSHTDDFRKRADLIIPWAIIVFQLLIFIIIVYSYLQYPYLKNTYSVSRVLYTWWSNGGLLFLDNNVVTVLFWSSFIGGALFGFLKNRLFFYIEFGALLILALYSLMPLLSNNFPL